MLFSKRPVHWDTAEAAKAWHADIAGHEEIEFCWPEVGNCFQTLMPQATSSRYDSVCLG